MSTKHFKSIHGIEEHIQLHSNMSSSNSKRVCIEVDIAIEKI